MCQKYQNEQKRQSRRDSVFAGVILILLCVLFGTAIVKGAEPKPWVRMTSPKTCTGVVIHASRAGGIHILTCAHCTNQEGKPAKFTLFKDGDETPERLDGTILKVHPEYKSSSGLNDVAYCGIAPEVYPQTYPLPNGVALCRAARKGQPVLAVGTNASRTVMPAMRELKISELTKDGRRIKLNEGAWGGHSGGPVLSVEARPKLIGVLWGRDSQQNSYSSVTGPAALHELVHAVQCSAEESRCEVGRCQCPGGICIKNVKPRSETTQLDNAWLLGGESEPQLTRPPQPAPPAPVVNDSKVQSLESQLDRLQGKLERSQDSVQRLTLDLTKKTAEVDILVTKYEQLDAENKSLADTLRATEAQAQQLSVQVNAPAEALQPGVEPVTQMSSIEVVASAKENMEEQIDNVGQMREILNQVPGSEYLSESAKNWLLMLIAVAVAAYAAMKHGEKKTEAKTKPPGDSSN